MTTPAEIVAAFHWLLGRAATAYEAEAWSAVPEAALRERLMATEAFATALPSSAVRMRDERQAIEWDVSSDIAAGLLARVQAHWTRLGETMPHWSVAVQLAFMPDQIESNRAAFLASGAQDVAHLVTVLARHGWQPGDLPRVMDSAAAWGG